MAVMYTNMNLRTDGFTYVIHKFEDLGGASGKIPHSVCISMVRYNQKTEMKMECNLSSPLSFTLDSGSMASEPWLAGTLSIWNDSTKKVTIKCA